MKCSCGKEAVYYRRNEGNFYCKACFCDQFEKKVKKHIRQGNLVAPGDAIAVALSGGKDSSTALYLMAKTFSKRKDVRIFALTIDEGIKGYRNRSLENAKALAKSLGVEHHVVSFKRVFGMSLDGIIRKLGRTPLKSGLGGACTWCGVFRRYALNKSARELGATKVCTGHNLDDEAQTFLINCLKGDTNKLFRSNSQIPSRKQQKTGFVQRIKPLRLIPEKEIALYAMLGGINNYWGECPYASGMRFEVRDFLNTLETNHPGIKFGLVEAFDSILSHAAAGKNVEESEILACESCGEPSSSKKCKACTLVDFIRK
ncbi:MAG: TIGR00269 family protein [Candidatus Aenigmatarchaeota archaeon]